MPRPAIITLLIAFAAMLAQGRATAGAWLQPAGGHYLKLSASYLDTDHEFDSEGDEVPLLSDQQLVSNTSFREVSIGAYLEYGLAEHATLVAAIPFKIMTSRRTELSATIDLSRRVEVTNGGLGDLYAGVRLPLREGRVAVFSAQGGLSVPTGYDDTPRNAGPSLGDGVANVDARLLAGASLWPLPAYLSGEIGFRVRGGDLDNEWFFALEGGGNWGPASLRAVLTGLYAMSDPPTLEQSSVMAVNNEDVVKVLAAAGYRLTPGVGVDLEIFHVLDGRDTVAGTTIAVGLVLSGS